MNVRYRVIYVILAVIIVAFSVRLISLQLISGQSYREQSQQRTMKTKVKEAPRGDIIDRYGRVMVTNKMSNSVVIKKVSGQTDEVLNELIKNLYILSENSSQYVSTTFPIVYENGTVKFFFEENEAEPKKREYAWKRKYGIEPDASANEALQFFSEKYSVSEPNMGYRLKITATRYEMTLRDFSYTTDFTFASNVPMDMITVIKEQQTAFTGADIKTSATRDYKYPSIATHLLGRVGKISAEELEAMRDDGYNINSLIGKQGIEKYAESYLRGTDGLVGVEQTKGGKNISEEIIKEARAGNNVTLTIDLDLQQAAQEALYDTIVDIRSKAKDAASGRYADSGAVVAVDVNTGEILAMASYPTYDTANFNQNYSELLNNNAKPLINRAIAGEYSPGSTFKMLIAAAALEEGVITPGEIITDKGIYTYYKDYQPRCWSYRQHGTVHGAINVTGALRDSCNYFFYDVGRRLGIEKIDEYAQKYGFGQITGVEIPSEEHRGVVASPESRKENNGIWYPGDTLQASIGQSDTLVTPIQLASYVSTIANGGTRYQLHLIKSIEDDAGKVLEETKSEVLSRVKLTDESYAAITRGMRLVVTEGTGENAFKNCPVPVAAKSGSAQMGRYTNGIYVAYAPYDNPQIAVAVVMEKSGGGSDAAPVARRVIEKYFAGEVENDSFTARNVLIG
ncbi:MAG: hypothetical protein IKU60_00490 [Clostridia bacterium]|nr:hypothetical protein [Clostridia bacterium]